MNRAAAIVIFPCIAVALSRPAFAYRPFDSTDAAVAGKGNLELFCPSAERVCRW